MAELPVWQPVDSVPPLTLQGSGTGRVVALVASERAVSEGWAAEAALHLARSWSAQGSRVVLADGALQSPLLHEATGIPNREGLSDAALYGASVSRVSSKLGDGILLIPAGTPVADAHAVVRSPRWFRLVGGFGEAGVMLLLFLRDDDPGATGFLGSASDIVVLAADGEAPPSAVSDLEPLVRAVTGMDEGGSGVAAAGGATAPAARGQGSGVTKSSGGKSKVLLFLLLVVIIAGVLGYVLTSGLG